MCMQLLFKITSSHLILTGDSKVPDLHLSPPTSWEEQLSHFLFIGAVHYRDTTPISAHPDVILPSCETGACDIRM